MNINRLINYLFLLLMVGCLIVALALPAIATTAAPPYFTRLSNEYINYDLGWANKVTQKLATQHIVMMYPVVSQ